MSRRLPVHEADPARLVISYPPYTGREPAVLLPLLRANSPINRPSCAKSDLKISFDRIDADRAGLVIRHASASTTPKSRALGFAPRPPGLTDAPGDARRTTEGAWLFLVPLPQPVQPHIGRALADEAIKSILSNICTPVNLPSPGF